MFFEEKRLLPCIASTTEDLPEPSVFTIPHGGTVPEARKRGAFEMKFIVPIFVRVIS